MAKQSAKEKYEVFDFGGTAYLEGSKTAIIFSDHKEMVGDSNTPKKDIEPKNSAEFGVDSVDFAKKGVDDKQPIDVMDKIFELSTIGSNVSFNAKMAYGDGIMVVKKVRDEKTGKVELREQMPSDQPEIFKFLEENNYVGCVQEWGNDIAVFNESYCEFVFARGKNKIVEINFIESLNSRLSIADEESGEIKFHGHSLKWHEGNPDDVVIAPLIDRRRALMDLRVRRGLNYGLDGKKVNTNKKNEYKYVLQLMLPTPGRYYYGKPYWWAIFVDWYEFALAIPKFKKALLQNQMVIKYHVKISVKFWPKYFKSLGILETETEKKKAKRKEFLLNMDKFLSGEKNAGKSFVSEFEYDKINKYEENDIIITPIESGFKGGEYLEDSSEVTNIICYAMEIHPSLIGATGKTGSINGTEARELFIIKQALQKPIRDLFVLPLYIAKNINGWDPDVHFVIPNIMLTTLDKNTGAEKQIGNQQT